MRKATHEGECQLCGRKQKLPNGELSNHGYTVEWGFFNGTCPGAHHLPYEKSCEQIKIQIPNVKKSIADLKANIAALKAESLPADKMRVQIYNNTVSAYQWVETKIAINEKSMEGGLKWNVAEYLMPEKTDRRKPEAHWHRNDSCHAKDIGGYRRHMTDLWIKELERGLIQYATYLAFLEKRVVEWKLKECEKVASPSTDTRKSARGVYILQGKEGFWVKYRMQRVFSGTKEECEAYYKENFKE